MPLLLYLRPLSPNVKVKHRQEQGDKPEASAVVHNALALDMRTWSDKSGSTSTLFAETSIYLGDLHACVEVKEQFSSRRNHMLRSVSDIRSGRAGPIPPGSFEPSKGTLQYCINTCVYTYTHIHIYIYIYTYILHTHIHTHLSLSSDKLRLWSSSPSLSIYGSSRRGRILLIEIQSARIAR